MAITLSTPVRSRDQPSHPGMADMYAKAQALPTPTRHTDSIYESFDNLDARAMVTLRNRLAGVSSGYHSCVASRYSMPVADA
jgi:hypothetical protein